VVQQLLTVHFEWRWGALVLVQCIVVNTVLGFYSAYLHKALEMVCLVSHACVTNNRHTLLVELLLVRLKTLYSESLLLGLLQYWEGSCTGSDVVNEEPMIFRFFVSPKPFEK
jgi:hypothetical protein